MANQSVVAETFLQKANCWDWIEVVSLIFLFHMSLVIFVSHRHCSREIKMLFLISWALTFITCWIQIPSYWFGPPHLIQDLAESIPQSSKVFPNSQSHLFSGILPSQHQDQAPCSQQVLGQTTTKLHSFPQPPSPPPLITCGFRKNKIMALVHFCSVYIFYIFQLNFIYMFYLFCIFQV